jgi:hypothetical protein
MFGPRINTVFRSRWRALWWALSVLVGVWFTVPHGHDNSDPDTRTGAEALTSLFSQKQPATPARHVNPWAREPQ